MSSEKPDQIQASVAAALSRLRGDLGPTGATAPKIEEPPMGERARPANDVRGDPFFRSIQAPPPPGTGMAGRGSIPMTPFPRMQTPQEPLSPEPLPQEPLSQEPEAPLEEESSIAPEASDTIDIPAMPEHEETVSEQVSMPEPPSLTTEPPVFTSGPQPLPEAPMQSAAATAAAVAASVNPLSRVMRGQAAPGAPSPSPAPMQRDLLADLPPPPISEPLVADTESGVVRRKRRNRRMLAAAAVIVIIALGAWLWTRGEPSTEVPVIAADATPEKIKPAAGEEGGLQVQNQNVQVLDPSTQTQTETVMPEPEQPITPPAASEAPAAEAPTVVENTDSNAAPTVQAPSVDVAPSPGVPLSETPLPAMEDNGTTAPAPAVTATEPTQTAEAPAASAPDQQQETVSPKVITIAPAETTPEPAPVVAAPAAQPEPAQAAAQPEPAPAAQPEQPAAQEAPTQEAAVTPVAPTGNTRVQLAAGKSEASVQKEWAALQQAHPTLLGALTLHIQKVDKGSAGIFYRLQAGPLADKNAAKELCASLKQKGQDCIVVTK